jgi:hypothetical protein
VRAETQHVENGESQKRAFDVAAFALIGVAAPAHAATIVPAIW